MKHRLTVKIEKRFKRQLSKRFDPRNASHYTYNCRKTINIECSLCKEYMPCITGRLCFACPFCEVKECKSTLFPCIKWINIIMGEKWFNIINTDTDKISWYEDDNKQAIQLLKKLREKAKKYIVWVEDTK